jgi:hypothetical protein
MKGIRTKQEQFGKRKMTLGAKNFNLLFSEGFSVHPEPRQEEYASQYG